MPPIVKTRATTRAAVLALVAATALWGSTFLVTKQTLPGTTPASLLVWRFGVAALVLGLIRAPDLRALPPVDRRHGAILGLFVGSGFLLQTTGLVGTPAGVSGFLTGTAVVLTPVVAATWFGHHVGAAGWLAVAGATAGVALLSLRGLSLTPAALLTLAGATCFAFHIASLSQWASRANAVGITAVSAGVAALLCAVVAVTQGGIEVPAGWAGWRSVLYLALGATCLGFVVQAWAQSVLSATTAAVVMTMEPVFAGLLAWVAGHEALGVAAWAGGIVVVASMFVAELGPRKCCDAMSPRIECC